MVELSRSSSVFFCSPHSWCLTWERLFLDYFCFHSQHSRAHSRTHTLHTISSSVLRVAGKAASCSDSLAAVAGEAWICIDLDPVTGVRGNVEHRVGRGPRAATAAAAAAGSTRGCLALAGGDGGGVRVHEEREELGLGR